MSETEEINKINQKLIRAYLSGEDSAFSGLVNNNIKSIYNFVYRLTGNQADAYDITQEVFIKVWENIEKFKLNHNFRTWVFTIARNTVVDWSRKKKSISFSDLEEESLNKINDSLQSETSSPEEVFDRIKNKEEMEGFLEKIPLIYKEIIILKYNEDLTFEEISEILKRPLNTIRSQHRRGLILLKQLIDKK